MKALKKTFFVNTLGSSLVCLKTAHMNMNITVNSKITFVGAEDSTELSIYKPDQSPIPDNTIIYNPYSHFMGSCLHTPL